MFVFVIFGTEFICQMESSAMLESIFVITNVVFFRGIVHDTVSIRSTFLEPSLINIPILVKLSPFSRTPKITNFPSIEMFLIVLDHTTTLHLTFTPLSLVVYGSALVKIDAFALHLAVLPLTFVDVAVVELSDAFSAFFVVFELTTEAVVIAELHA